MGKVVNLDPMSDPVGKSILTVSSYQMSQAGEATRVRSRVCQLPNKYHRPNFATQSKSDVSIRGYQAAFDLLICRDA